MADKVFPNGIRAFKPRETAPAYVKAEIVISKADFKNWMLTEGDEIKLTLKESQKGTYYFEVNSFVPTQKAVQSIQSALDDDLPFNPFR